MYVNFQRLTSVTWATSQLECVQLRCVGEDRMEPAPNRERRQGGGRQSLWNSAIMAYVMYLRQSTVRSGTSMPQVQTE